MGAAGRIGILGQPPPVVRQDRVDGPAVLGLSLGIGQEVRQVRAHYDQGLSIDQGKDGGAEPVDIRTADHQRDQLEGF